MTKDKYYNFKIMNKGYGKTYHEMQQLITKMQQENEKLKGKSDILEKTNATLIQQKYDLERELDGVLDRIDKAIEWLDYDNMENYFECPKKEMLELLNILQGSEE